MTLAIPARWPGGLAALCVAADAMARAGAGNHAGSTQNSDGGFSLGAGGSLGALILLVIIVFGIRFVLRRVGGNPLAGQALRTASPAAQSAISMLGSALGASGLARIAAGDMPGASGPGVAGAAMQPALAAIQAGDPGFEMETFLQRAEMTFFLVKRGMQRNDAAAVRPYVNDVVFAGLSQNLAQARAQHRHALLESLNVRGLAIEHVDCDAHGQRVQVHFDLIYRAKRVDDSNAVVEDEGQEGRHAERWTFARNAGARTSLSGGVIASKCPACGAELRLGLDGVCAHCKASVTSGAVDWVVADVQPAAFVGYGPDSSMGSAAATVADGIAALGAADKDFALAAFQARVRTAFLALQDAWCQQKLDAGRAFLSPGAYFTWSAQLETLAAEGRRNVLEHLEIRSIETVRVIHGRVFDDLTVRITAAAADFDIDASGKVVYGDHTVRPFQEDWTFQRSVGVETSNKPGTLENTCPNCGAPVALTQIGECRYCRAAVSSGKFDWVVSRIDQEDDVGYAPSLDHVGEQIALQAGGAVARDLIGKWISKGL